MLDPFSEAAGLQCFGASRQRAGLSTAAETPLPGPPNGPPQPHTHLLTAEQPEGMLDGRALVQQQRFELAFLDVIEGVEHYSQELRGRSRGASCWQGRDTGSQEYRTTPKWEALWPVPYSSGWSLSPTEKAATCTWFSAAGGCGCCVVPLSCPHQGWP